MSELTPNKMKRLFMAIELNLVIWLFLCCALWSSTTVSPQIQYWAPFGMLVAALLQHWAYYDLYKTAKEQQK
ncbi:MAG: hypothetical protein WCP55_05325 [Lentisphaerota bacterium]